MMKKPAWMYFAAQAQQRLDQIKPSKSGKREEQCLRDTWKTATDQYGYNGSERDWEILILRIGRGEIKIGTMPKETPVPMAERNGFAAFLPRTK